MTTKMHVIAFEAHDVSATVTYRDDKGEIIIVDAGVCSVGEITELSDGTRYIAIYLEVTNPTRSKCAT